MKKLVLVVALLSITMGAIAQLRYADSTEVPITDLEIRSTNSSNLAYFGSTIESSHAVAVIDSTGVVTIPKGWSFVLVIKNGEGWTFDSTKVGRRVSIPERYSQ
jgi:hypothetical protein